MDESNATPVKRRVLGIKLTIKKGKIPKTPLSDGRLSDTPLYGAFSSPTTPSLDSTNTKPKTCLQNKSLNRASRGRYGRKKLEFIKESISDECNVSGQALELRETQSQSNRILSDEELEHLVAEKTIILQSLKCHESKVKDLKAAITKWKTAFNSLLDDLSSKPGLPSDRTELLESLNLPQEMIKYFTDI